MTMANSEAGAAQAENEVLAKRCDAVANAAQSAIGWLADAGDLVREEGPALARDFRREGLRARRLANAARRPMCCSSFAPCPHWNSYASDSLAPLNGCSNLYRLG